MLKNVLPLTPNIKSVFEIGTNKGITIRWSPKTFQKVNISVII